MTNPSEITGLFPPNNPSPVVSELRLEVEGYPEPKGSYRALILGKSRPPRCACRAILVPSHSDASKEALELWKRSIRGAVEGFTKPFVDRALAVTITFYVERPKGHFRTNGELKPNAPRYPRWKPDADKLLRSTLDGLKDLAFDDDARIVDLHTYKRYADGFAVGASILVTALAD